MRLPAFDLNGRPDSDRTESPTPSPADGSAADRVSAGAPLPIRSNPRRRESRRTSARDGPEPPHPPELAQTAASVPDRSSVSTSSPLLSLQHTAIERPAPIITKPNHRRND